MLGCRAGSAALPPGRHSLLHGGPVDLDRGKRRRLLGAVLVACINESTVAVRRKRFGACHFSFEIRHVLVHRDHLSAAAARKLPSTTPPARHRSAVRVLEVVVARAREARVQRCSVDAALYHKCAVNRKGSGIITVQRVCTLSA